MGGKMTDELSSDLVSMFNVYLPQRSPDIEVLQFPAMLLISLAQPPAQAAAQTARERLRHRGL